MMKCVLGLRVALALFVAVLVPLEAGHCGWSTVRSPVAAGAFTHHDDGDHDCCPEPEAPGRPVPPDDPCCCVSVQGLAATSPASFTVDGPSSTRTPFATSVVPTAITEPRSAELRCAPDGRSESPPGTSSPVQSPRAPPSFA